MTKNQKRRNAAHRAAMSSNSNKITSVYIQGVGKDNIQIVEDRYNYYKTCEYETAFETHKDILGFLIDTYSAFMLEKREEAVGEAYIVIGDKFDGIKFRTAELRERFERFMAETAGISYEDFLKMARA